MSGHSPDLHNECVHCGFCLPACPTYQLLGTEMDSPRGRLHLMRALEDGRIAPTREAVRHLDLCFGCRACETECPSGVPFGRHLEEARARTRTASARPLGKRILESLALRAVALPRGVQTVGARLLRALQVTGVARSLAWLLPASSRIGGATRLLSATPVRFAELPPVTPAVGARRMRVGFLEGCVGRTVFGAVNVAGARLLARAGCEVIAPRGQRCCGALHAHAGDLDGARALARTNIDKFESTGAGDLDAIVVAAAGCGAAMKEYGTWLADDPAYAVPARQFSARARDVLEILAQSKGPAPSRPIAGRLAYHDACHLAHAQGIRNEPRSLLAAVPGLMAAPLLDSERCCGSAGLYNVLEPDVARMALRDKLARLAESGATIVAAANPGCLMQIAAGLREAGHGARVVHPLELLDEACGPQDDGSSR